MLWHALARRGVVGMGRVHLEIGPPVVQDDARVGDDDSGPEHIGNAGDQRDRVAVAVDDGEVGRVAIDAARRRGIQGEVRLNQRAALAEIFLRQETLDRRRGEARIGDALDGVGEGELDRLEDEMLRQNFVFEKKAGQIIGLDDAESHQGDDALSVGRDLEDGVSAVSGAERLDPLGLLSIEIFAVEEAAGLVQDVEDAVPDFAGIERGAAILADRSPGFCEVRLPENLSRLRRAAAGQVGRRVGRESPELRGAPFPRMADLGPYGEAFLGVSRGGFDEIGEIHRAEALVQRKIAVERAGDRDGRCSGLRHGGKAGGAKVVDGEARPRAAAAVEAKTLAVPVREDHAVAAEPVHHRLGHVDHRSHGDRRVGGVAARFQNVPADRRRERLTRTGHSGLGEDRGSLRIEWLHDGFGLTCFSSAMRLSRRSASV